MFKNRRFKSSTAVLVLVAFAWMAFGGDAWAEKRAAERDPARVLTRLAEDPRLGLSPEEKAYVRRAAQRLKSEPPRAPARVPAARADSDPVGEMQGITAELSRLAARADGKSLGESQDLEGLTERLEKTHERILVGFAAVADHLREARLPRQIQERQEAARAEYLKNIKKVFVGLDAARRSQSPGEAKAALAGAAALLARSGKERPRQPFDPSKLPFRTAKPASRRPGAGTVAGHGKTRVAFHAKAAAPTPADLAANEDVQITQEVRDLAASLGNQPIKIYNWVRNNVEVIPTYGSVQGAQMTLVSKRGNPFDTASLLIALLRAAGVPARYVTGMVDVPVATAMNWVGGAENSAVAQRLLAQGGVPNVAVESGGTVTHLRIDHVWVEAFLSYVPSRGTVQRPGDTWVPMDASFKLHSFTPRSGVFADNPFSAVLQPGDHLFDVDESLGKITNVDDEILDDRMADWASRSDEYLLGHGSPASAADLVGGQSIVSETLTVFAGSLPYRVIHREGSWDSLPESLRHFVTLNGYASDVDHSLGNTAFSVKLSLSALNSRRLGIQFAPATQADADTLALARTSGASSLPLYLVDVAPVITLDGVEQARGGSIRMGSFYSIDAVLEGPEDSATIPYKVVAGDEIVAGITGNGVSREVIEKRFAENPVNDALEYLHEVGLYYWTECDYFGGITARAQGVHSLRLPSVGFFSSPLTVSYLFGAPSFGVYASRIMDVKQSLLGVASADSTKLLAFAKQAGGQDSYLEGSVFDQLEGRPMPAIKGISSVHLIAAATAQGVPIYRITPANSGNVLPLLQVGPTAADDIRTAVNQGKTVIVPERDINIGPWSGVGYIIQDEATGAGAYLISGGANGGGLVNCVKELSPQAVQILAVVLLFILLLILAVLLVGALPELTAALAAAGVAAGAFTSLLFLWRAMGSLAVSTS